MQLKGVFFILSAACGVYSQDCRDFDHSCPYWGSIGECEANPVWMRNNCRLSCSVCGSSTPDREPRYRSLESDYIGGGGIITAQSLNEQLQPAADGIASPWMDNAVDHWGTSTMLEVIMSPRAYIIDNFITHDEADILRDLATPQLRQSLTINRTTGEYEVDVVRTNRQMSMTNEQVLEHATVNSITRRAHRLARSPLAHAEHLQVGHYGMGEKYEPHFDSEQAQHVMRAATVIMYLSDVSAGGHTVFPMGSKCAALKDCCILGADRPRGAVLVAPRKGRAVLFYSHDLNGRMNLFSRHGSCPVVKLEDAGDEVGPQGGPEEKWISQQWFRVDQYTTSPHYRELPQKSAEIKATEL